VPQPPIQSLSVIIPAYNEAGVIGQTLRRIKEIVEDGSVADRLQLIAVSDASTDKTFEESVDGLGGSDGVVVELVSNAGSHSAIRCGLQYATGDVMIIMAADGQDPPETIPELVAALRPGIDIVWARRASRAHDPRLRRILAGGYYWLFRRLTGLDYPPGGFDFVAVTRAAAESLLRYKERNTSIFLLLFNLGFGQAAVEYERAERIGGESGWTLGKRMKLAVDMLTAFSASPLRLVSATGFLVGVAGLAFGGVTVIRALLGNVPVSGWASLMVVSSLMGGLTLVALGLLGEYVWRTLEEARSRPLYIEARHFDSSSGSP